MLADSPPVIGFGKGDDVGLGVLEGAAHPADHLWLGRLVGPQRERAAVGEHRRHLREPRDGVQVTVVLAQQPVGGMVDVQQHRVVGAVGAPRAHQVEEVVADQAHPRVRGQSLGVREQVALVPGDDRLEGLDDGQLADPVVLEGRRRRVTEPQPAHQHRQ